MVGLTGFFVLYAGGGDKGQKHGGGDFCIAEYIK